VTGGGRGRARFVTSEGASRNRTVVAEVSQDGLPRDNIVVAHFVAPPPVPTRPLVRVVRHGTKATVTWTGAKYAALYDVVVQTGDGNRILLSPTTKARKVQFGGLTKGEGAVVTVAGITAGGRRGPKGTAHLSGSLRLVAHHNIKRRKPKRHPHKPKRHRG
jgi:hypothetical protein